VARPIKQFQVSLDVMVETEEEINAIGTEYGLKIIKTEWDETRCGWPYVTFQGTYTQVDRMLDGYDRNVYKMVQVPEPEECHQ